MAPLCPADGALLHLTRKLLVGSEPLVHALVQPLPAMVIEPPRREAADDASPRVLEHDLRPVSPEEVPEHRPLPHGVRVAVREPEVVELTEVEAAHAVGGPHGGHREPFVPARAGEHRLRSLGAPFPSEVGVERVPDVHEGHRPGARRPESLEHEPVRTLGLGERDDRLGHSELTRHAPLNGLFVEVRVGEDEGERDRCFQSLRLGAVGRVHGIGHGVDSAAQEDRRPADHKGPVERLFQERRKVRQIGLRGPLHFFLARRGIPVPRRRDPGVVRCERRSGRDPANRFEIRLRRVEVIVDERLGQRGAVERSRYLVCTSESDDGVREVPGAVEPLRVEKRVLAESIPSGEHRVGAGIPEGQCEDAVDPLQDLRADLEVGTEDELRWPASGVDACNARELVRVEEVAVEDREAQVASRDGGARRPRRDPGLSLPWPVAQGKRRGVGRRLGRLERDCHPQLPARRSFFSTSSAIRVSISSRSWSGGTSNSWRRAA